MSHAAGAFAEIKARLDTLGERELETILVGAVRRVQLAEAEGPRGAVQANFWGKVWGYLRSYYRRRKQLKGSVLNSSVRAIKDAWKMLK